jgi:hypothetical protein
VELCDHRPEATDRHSAGSWFSLAAPGNSIMDRSTAVESETIADVPRKLIE